MISLKVCLFSIVLIISPVFLVSADAGDSFYIKEGHILVDQKGRQVTLDKPFKRIISLYGAHTENLFYLGLDQEIIGVTRSDTYPEKALEKTVFSQKDDPEKFLAEKPDLILIRPMLDRGYAKLFNRLEQSGITVVSLQPKNVEEMLRYWEILGFLTGKTKEARRMAEQFNTSLEAYLLLTREIEIKQKVYFEAIHKKMKTFTKGAMADFVLVTAGGVNLAADGTPSRGTNIAIYGKERILAKASEIDVFIAQKGAMNRISRDIIKNEPGFQIIKAVQNDRILIVDEKIVSRPGMRLLYGISEIGTYLYPDLFKERSEEILKEVFGL
jgi:iron complex transport system substrate-binding protein